MISYRRSELIKIIELSIVGGQLARKKSMRFSTSGNVDRWLPMLRISIGIIYLWFGSLKFFPGVSPAEELAKETIRLLTFGLIKPDLSLLLLALWETIAGAVMVVGLSQKWVIRVLFVHMGCTFMPLFLLPGLCFTAVPFALTLVGQYIIKNIVIVSALLVLDSSKKKGNN
jgi:uncharacterized membrane protein YphA (DoxX/SURF4 family)